MLDGVLQIHMDLGGSSAVGESGGGGDDKALEALLLQTWPGLSQRYSRRPCHWVIMMILINTETLITIINEEDTYWITR